MADRFHISPDGNPRPCSAEVKCRYGDGTPHYANKDDARAAFEEMQKTSDVTPTKINLAQAKSDSWAVNAYEAFEERRQANEDYATLIPEARKVRDMLDRELSEGNLTAPAARLMREQRDVLRMHLRDWKELADAKYLESFTPKNEKKLVHLAKDVFGTRAGEDLQDEFIRGNAEKVRDVVGELMEQASDSALADRGLTYPKLRAMLDSGH